MGVATKFFACASRATAKKPPIGNSGYAPVIVLKCNYDIISLAVNRLGKLRDDLDANLTYEGDNNVILLQTSNYLLDVYEKKKAGMWHFI